MELDQKEGSKIGQIFASFGNNNSIQKVKNMELEQKEGSKIGQFFALKN